MKSNVIEGVLREELERNHSIMETYKDQLKCLPKGVIIKRERNNAVYCYLHYREGEKVISKYIGKENSAAINDLKKQIEKRKNICRIIKKLEIEKKELLQILKIR